MAKMQEYHEVIERDALSFKPNLSDKTIGIDMCLITNLRVPRFIETWTTDEKWIYSLPKPLNNQDSLIVDYYALSSQYIQEIRGCTALTELTLEGCVLDEALLETLKVVVTPRLQALRLENVLYDARLLAFLPFFLPKKSPKIAITWVPMARLRAIQFWSPEGSERTISFAEPRPDSKLSAESCRKISEDVVKQLRHCRGVQELTITGRGMDKQLLEALHHLTRRRLKTLTLDEWKTNPAMGLGLQFPTNYQLPELANLTLDTNECKLSEKGARFTARYAASILSLFNPKSIEYLTITGNWFTADAYRFVGFFGGCPRLTHLVTVLADKELADFAYFLAECPMLISLNVTHTPRVPFIHQTEYSELEPDVCPNLEELSVPAALLPYFYPLNEMRPRLETVVISDPYSVSYEHEKETQARLVSAMKNSIYLGCHAVKRLQIGTVSSTWKDLRAVLRRIPEVFSALESLVVLTYDTETSMYSRKAMTQIPVQEYGSIFANTYTYESILMDIAPGVIDLPDTLVDFTIINHSPNEMADDVEQAFLRSLNHFQGPDSDLYVVRIGHQASVSEYTREPGVDEGWHHEVIGRCVHQF